MSRDAPHPPRRHRALSDEERRLWQAVARSATPLKQKKRPVRTDHAAAPREDVSANEATAAATAPRATRPAPPAKAAPPSLARLSRREKSRLSRGREEIAARLDLHGMTQARAHAALLSFLKRARADGATFVLVITGKGRASGAEREVGVLRKEVPRWLALAEFRALVVGCEPAHAAHGGEGALYVRLRRSRF